MPASGTITQSDEIKVVPCQEITNPTPLVTRLNLAEIDSLISPFIRRRSDEFTQQETTLLIEEIGKLRHILLSKASHHSRMKKKAWEELKKKWENIVLKTRRILRDGLLAEQMERNETLRMVVQFLIEANQAKGLVEESGGTTSATNEQMSMEYSDNLLISSQFGTESVASAQETVNAVTNVSNTEYHIQSPQVIQIKRDENETPVTANAGTHTATNSTDVGSEVESDEDSSANEDTTEAIVFPNADGSPHGWNIGDESNLTGPRKRKIIHKELLRHSKAEHKQRMKILDIKYRYWKLKFDSLKRKVAQEDQQQQ
ncbi:unnamed protein product [Rodentolepis nana]|uniref:Myb_DNA-bind_5 domain-containing protein n=1 Tax=Rodentolepis nana TaxID=102285 RepID=A0A158QJ15_RODNA|nr:unnamed protein product [Rodentolepis nana]